jgi:hypothetical protein
MPLPNFGTQKVVPNITKDSSISHHIENGIHRVIFDNIESTKRLMSQRTTSFDSTDPYATYHRHLKNFHNTTLASNRNSGFNIKCINPNWYRLDPGIKDLDFGTTIYTKQQYQFERQKDCVYLFSDRNGNPLEIGCSKKDFSHFHSDMTDGTNKFFLKGWGDFPENNSKLGFDEIYDNNNSTYIDDAFPLCGFILDHNGSLTNPIYFILGWNRKFQLKLFKFSILNGFEILTQFYLNQNNLYYNWGRLNGTQYSIQNDAFVGYRKPKRGLHYGKNYLLSNTQRIYMTSYHWIKDMTNNVDRDCYFDPITISNLDDPFRLGFFFTPGNGFGIQGFKWGYDFEGF